MHLYFIIFASLQLSKEHDSTDLSPEEEEPDEVYFAPPEMKIHVVAQDVLELTVSKTCLDVLSNLGQVYNYTPWWYFHYCLSILINYLLLIIILLYYNTYNIAYKKKHFVFWN